MTEDDVEQGLVTLVAAATVAAAGDVVDDAAATVVAAAVAAGDVVDGAAATVVTLLAAVEDATQVEVLADGDAQGVDEHPAVLGEADLALLGVDQVAQERLEERLVLRAAPPDHLGDDVVEQVADLDVGAVVVDQPGGDVEAHLVVGAHGHGLGLDHAQAQQGVEDDLGQLVTAAAPEVAEDVVEVEDAAAVVSLTLLGLHGAGAVGALAGDALEGTAAAASVLGLVVAPEDAADVEILEDVAEAIATAAPVAALVVEEHAGDADGGEGPGVHGRDLDVVVVGATEPFDAAPAAVTLVVVATEELVEADTEEVALVAVVTAAAGDVVDDAAATVVTTVVTAAAGDVVEGAAATVTPAVLVGDQHR